MRVQLTAVGALNLLLYALYFIHLKADFPNNSPWNDFAKYTDEGWYAGAALHTSQTGQWYVSGGFNPAVGLPLWPLLLAVWFHIAGGPGIVAARALAVLCFGASALLLYLLLRPVTSRLVASLTVTLVLVNPYCFAFDRLALLEPLAVLFFLLALWIATLQSVPVLRAMALGVLLTAATLTKTTAAVLAPAVLYALWATAAGPVGSTASSRWRRVRDHVAADRAALRLPFIAVATAAAVWAAYFSVLVRLHYLDDFRHLFAVNAGRAHGTILLQVMARALGDTLWIDRILLPMTIVAVAASTRFLRELWRLPLYVSSVLALAATIGWIGWHTWFQPRYYLMCVFPAMIVIALATHALHTRARQSLQGLSWRIAYNATLLLLAIAAATMLLQTSRWLLHPSYSMRNAAEAIAAHMRADSTVPPALLSPSADTFALFTGIHPINPEWPLTGLPALLAAQPPGWYAGYAPLDDKRSADLRMRYVMTLTAQYRVFDEPEHRSLNLYRLQQRSTAREK